MFSTMREFINCVESLENISDAYDIFEYECSESLRDRIYQFADSNDVEPFRAAMHNLGFKNF